MKWHDAQPGLICQICRFQPNDEQSLRQHMELHQKIENRLTCVICKKTASQVYALRIHVQNKHVSSLDEK